MSEDAPPLLSDAELLAPIWNAPADDDPRLRYAAQLSERDDPRGDYERVACEMARAGSRSTPS